MKAADQTIKRHNIFHPAAGEPITVGQQTNTYSILLSDEVLETIHMSKVSLHILSSRPLLISFLTVQFPYACFNSYKTIK